MPASNTAPVNRIPISHLSPAYLSRNDFPAVGIQSGKRSHAWGKINIKALLTISVIATVARISQPNVLAIEQIVEAYRDFS
jgi:hypothetical protein